MQDSKGAYFPQIQPLEKSSTDFHRSRTVIAVDVSASTRGKVIEQEIATAQCISSTLSESAASQTLVIPWDRYTQRFLALKDIQKLPHGSGTKPSSLTSDLNSVEQIRKCSTWILFTDGKIADEEIRTFSQGLCTNGLHGISCVVVLFGRTNHRPIDSNVSVGVSIFGLVPNCLFLYHDINNGVVSILQSKGVFNKLLPQGHATVSLNEDSKWRDLPTIRYSDLEDIEIPTSQPLSSDHIELQSRRVVSLTDIYNDKVDAVTANELLEVEDNLKTLLLTSEIKGKRDDVKSWISNQKAKTQDVLNTPRPDIENTAATCIKELVSLGTTSPDLNQKRTLQTKLRNARQQNGIAFLSKTNTERTRLTRRKQIIHSALDRVAANAEESHQNSWTARMFGPVVSTGPQESSVAAHTDKIPSSHQIMPPSCDDQLNEGESSTSSASNANILFLQGFKHQRGPSSLVHFEGECSLCGDENILAILVKQPSQNPLPALPDYNYCVEFSLAIGSHAGAKVISSFLCCNACAYHLAKLNISPNCDMIIGAIPLIHEAITGEYQEKSLATLERALNMGFDRSTLEMVFLSILYNTFLDLDEEVAKKAVHWAALSLASSISVHATLSSSLDPEPSVHHWYQNIIPLQQALRNSFDEKSQAHRGMLQYPLAGFVVLINCMADFELDESTVLLKRAIFQRLLYLVTENHHRNLLENGNNIAAKRLGDLIWSSESGAESQAMEDDSFEFISTPNVSVSVVSLVTQNLISFEDISTFRRLGPLFAQVEVSYSFALAAFLHILCKEKPEIGSTSMEVYDRIKNQEAIYAVVEKPESIGDVEAEALISSICFGLSRKDKVVRPYLELATTSTLDEESGDFDMISGDSYGGAI